MLHYLHHVMLGFDHFANAIFGGDANDTISYRSSVAQAEGKKWGCVMCKFLDLFQRDHCGITLRGDLHERLIWGRQIEKGEMPL